MRGPASGHRAPPGGGRHRPIHGLRRVSGARRRRGRPGPAHGRGATAGGGVRAERDGHDRRAQGCALFHVERPLPRRGRAAAPEGSERRRPQGSGDGGDRGRPPTRWALVRTESSIVRSDRMVAPVPRSEGAPHAAAAPVVRGRVCRPGRPGASAPAAVGGGRSGAPPRCDLRAGRTRAPPRRPPGRPEVGPCGRVGGVACPTSAAHLREPARRRRVRTGGRQSAPTSRAPERGGPARRRQGAGLQVHRRVGTTPAAAVPRPVPADHVDPPRTSPPTTSAASATQVRGDRDGSRRRPRRPDGAPMGRPPAPGPEAPSRARRRSRPPAGRAWGRARRAPCRSLGAAASADTWRRVAVDRCPPGAFHVEQRGRDACMLRVVPRGCAGDRDL